MVDMGKENPSKSVDKYYKGQMTLANAVMYFVTFLMTAILFLPVINQAIEQVMVPNLMNNSSGQMSPMADLTILFARFIPLIFVTALLVSVIKTAVPQFEGDRRYQ